MLLLFFFFLLKVSCANYFDIQGEVSLRVATTTVGLFKIQSDIDAIKDVLFSFNHEGSLTNFINHLEFSLGQGWKIQLDSDMALMPNIAGNLELQTPFEALKNVILKFNHDGAISDFTNGVEVHHNNAKLFKATSTLSLDKKIEGSFQLETPIPSAKEIIVNLKHKGHLRRFQCFANIHINGEECGKFQLKVKSRPVLEAHVELINPFMEDIKVDISQQGSMSNFNAQIMGIWGKQVVKSEVDLKTSPFFAGSVKLTTPFSQIEAMEIAVSHKGASNNFQTEVAMSHNDKQMVESKVSFSTDDKTVGTMTIITAFDVLRNAEISFNHYGNLAGFEAEASVTYNSDPMFQGKTTFQISPAVEASVVIKAPVDTEIIYSHMGAITNFQINSAVAYNGERIFNTQVSFNAGSQTEGAFTIETALSNFEEVSAHFTHHGGLTDFASAADLTYNRQSIFDGRTTFKLTSNVEGSMTVKVPSHNIEFSFQHTLSSLANISTRASISHNEQNIYSHKLTTKTGSQINGAFYLATALSSLRNLDMEFGHRGGLTDFETEASFNYNDKMVKGKTTFQTNPTLEATLALKTPLIGMEDMEIILHHRGAASKFQTNLAMTLNKEDKYEASANFHNTPNVDLSLTMKTPITFMRSGYFSFSHKGGISNFEVTASASYNDRSVLDAGTFFRMSEVIEGAISVMTPIKKLSASFNHRGNLASFQTTSDIAYDGNKIDAQLAFDLQPFSVQIKMRTPFKLLNEVIVKLACTFNGQEFKILNEANINLDKIHLTGTMNMQPMSFNVDITSTFEALRQMSIFATLHDSKKAFTAEVKHNEKTIGMLDVEYKNYDKMSGNLRFQTDFDQVYGYDLESMKDISLSFHNSFINGELKSGAELSYTPSKVISTGIELIVNPSITGHISFQSPFTNFENIKASINMGKTAEGMNIDVQTLYAASKYVAVRGHIKYTPYLQSDIAINTPMTGEMSTSIKFEQSAKSITLNADARYGASNAIVLTSTITLAPYKEAHISLQTPFRTMEALSARVKYETSTTGIKADMQASYSPSKNINGNLEFTISPELQAHVRLQTPFANMRDMSATFNHKMDVSAINTYTEVIWAPSKSISFDIKLKFKPTIDCQVSIETPFDKMKYMSLSLNHNLDSSSLATHVSATYAKSKIISADLSLRFAPQMEGELHIQTPFANMKEMSAAFSQKMDNNGIVSHIEATYAPSKVVTGDVNIKFNPLVKGQIRVTSPFTQAMSLVFNHKIKKNGVVSHIEAKHGSSRVILGDINIRMKPALEGQISLQTPFTYIKDLSLSVLHKNDAAGIVSHVDAKYAARKMISADFNLKYQPQLEGEILMKTPFTEDMSLGFNHKMDSSSIVSNLKASYSPSKVISVDINLQHEPELTGEVLLKTPFTEDMSLGFKHKMDGSSIVSNIRASYSPSKVISGDINLQHKPELTGQLNVKTPFKGFKSTTLKLRHSLSDSNLNSDVEVSYGHNQNIKGEVTFSRTKRSFSSAVKLTTPFKNMEDLSANVQYENSDKMVKGSTSMQYATNKAVSVSAIYTQPRRLMVSFRTPFNQYENVNMDMSYTQNGNRYEPSASLTWGRNQKIETTVSLVNIGSWYKKSLKGNLLLRTPFPDFHHLEIQAEHMHSRSGIVSKVNTDFNMKKVIDCEVQYSQDSGRHTGVFVMRTPLPVSAEITGQGDLNNFNSELALKINNDQIRTQLTHKSSEGKRLMSVHITTPRRTAVILSDLQQSANKLFHKAEFTWDEAAKQFVSHQLTIITTDHSYNIRSHIDTPIRSLEAHVSHSKNINSAATRATLLWDAAKDKTKKVEIKNHFQKSTNHYKNELTLSLPKMQKVKTIYLN